MRISEATSLRWEDIDERHEVIHVRRSHWRGQVGTTKTRRTRTVPLRSDLTQALAEHRQHMLSVQAPGLAAGWVFPSKVGTLMSHVTLQKPLKAALSAAGISERFTLHGFRRTFNNLLRQATTGEVVRSMTGHVTERMTEHYSHVATAEKHRAVLRALPSFTDPSATQSGAQVGTEVGTRGSPTKTPVSSSVLTGGNRAAMSGAGEGIRTLDVNLGNVGRPTRKANIFNIFDTLHDRLGGHTGVREAI